MDVSVAIKQNDVREDVLAYLLYTLQVELLIRLSEMWRLLSSNKSFTAVTPSTNSTGIMATSFPNAFMEGNQFNNTIRIKYKLATLWNCSKRFLGMKDNRVYFVVRTLLSIRFPLGCSFLGVFGGTTWLGYTLKYLRSSAAGGLRSIHPTARLHSDGPEFRRSV